MMLWPSLLIYYILILGFLWKIQKKYAQTLFLQNYNQILMLFEIFIKVNLFFNSSLTLKNAPYNIISQGHPLLY